MICETQPFTHTGLHSPPLANLCTRASIMCMAVQSTMHISMPAAARCQGVHREGFHIWTGMLDLKAP